MINILPTFFKPVYTHSDQNQPDNLGNLLLTKAFSEKHLKEKCWSVATLIQIFCQILLNSQKIFKSMTVAEDTF